MTMQDRADPGTGEDRRGFRMSAQTTSLAITFGLLLVIMLAAALYSPSFRSSRNIFNVLRQSVVLGTVSIGQTLVILSGGIDLSVGSVVKLTSLLAAIAMDGEQAMTAPVVVGALVVGVVVGFVNAMLVIRARVAPFIATLGTFTIVRGLALAVSIKPVGRASRFISDLYGSRIGPVPHIVLVSALVWILALFALWRTVWSRHVYAVGGNDRVARLAGINVDRVRLLVYCLSGMLAALAGLFTLSRISIGDPVVGEGLELDSITAVVLGGTSLFGGRGTLVGTLVGVLLLGLINNVLNILQISVWYQQLIKGFIIVGAIALYRQPGR